MSTHFTGKYDIGRNIDREYQKEVPNVHTDVLCEGSFYIESINGNVGVA